MGITATDPYNAPQRRVGFLSGNPQATSVRIVVATFRNTPVTVRFYSNVGRTTLVTTVNVAVEGGAAPALAKYANDREEFDGLAWAPAADAAGQTWFCYVAAHTVTALTANTKYYLTIEQDGIIEADASTCTAPSATADFRVYMAGCDRSLNYGAKHWTKGGGAWRYIKRDVINNPNRLTYLVWADDLGYADHWNMVNDIPEDTLTGKKPGSKTFLHPTAYGYAMTYCALLGMLGQEAMANPGTSTEGNLRGTTQLHWGADRNRMWCQRNMPMACQWGDHEFVNNIGQSPFALDLFPDGTDSTQPTVSTSYYIKGKAAWDGLFGQLNPTPSIKSLNTTANHWALTLGELRILAPDALTMSPGAPSGGPVSIDRLSDGQIRDVLAAATVASPLFKCVVLAPVDLQDWIDGSAGQEGATRFAGEFTWKDEYHRFVWAPAAETGGQPDSLMQSAYTNGASGVLVFMHGDWHSAFVQRYTGKENRHPEDGLGLTGNWTLWNYGMTGGRNEQVISDTAKANIAAGYRGLSMLAPPVYGTGPTAAEQIHTYSTVALDVYGSETPKRLRCTLLRGSAGIAGSTPNDSNSTAIVYAADFKVGSNLPQP